MHHFALLLLVVVTVGYTSGYKLVAAPFGTCVRKRAYGIVHMRRGQCATMGGKWNGSPGYDDWTDCHMDWCEFPSSGAVSSGYAWGVDIKQEDRTISSTRTYGIFILTRSECDRIHGRYNGNPKAGDWLDCHLYMKRMDGTTRRKINSLIFAGDGQCHNKVVGGILRMTHRECLQNGGRWNGDPGSNDWIHCHLDICVSPVVDCEPSDMWSTIQVCKNPSSASFTCSFEMSVGIERGVSSDSTTGGDVSVEVTAEAGVDLMGIFTASLSVSVATGFHWEKTYSSSQTWSSATTRSLEVNLDPGQAVSIDQVIGTCGSYKIDTTEYRVRDVTHKK